MPKEGISVRAQETQQLRSYQDLFMNNVTKCFSTFVHKSGIQSRSNTFKESTLQLGAFPRTQFIHGLHHSLITNDNPIRGAVTLSKLKLTQNFNNSFVNLLFLWRCTRKEAAVLPKQTCVGDRKGSKDLICLIFWNQDKWSPWYAHYSTKYADGMISFCPV